MKVASPPMQTKLLTPNYHLLSVFLCFCSNGKRFHSEGISYPYWESARQHHHSLPTPSTPLLPPLTPLSISFYSILFSSFARDTSTPPNPIRCAIIHLQRAVPSLNGIIIGPALVLIAKMTIARASARLNACASLAASDTSVALWMSVDRCARWSRTAGERGDLDINEMVTKLALANYKKVNGGCLGGRGWGKRNDKDIPLRGWGYSALAKKNYWI